MTNVAVGSLVLLKPNNHPDYQSNHYQLMGVEKITDGVAWTSWLDDKAIPHKMQVPVTLLWNVQHDL